MNSEHIILRVLSIPRLSYQNFFGRHLVSGPRRGMATAQSEEAKAKVGSAGDDMIFLIQ